MKTTFNPEIKYFESFEQDFVFSNDQYYKIPHNFKWVHTNLFYRLVSSILYRVAEALIVVTFPIVYGMRCCNKKVLKKVKDSGYFIYANHTQPFADVFMPSFVQKKKRVYVVAGRANLGVPVMGKLLPSLGAITVPAEIERMPLFLEAISYHIKRNKAVAIYPEAHVWPYATLIRPFPVTSFRFPVKENVPVFAFTTTYQKRKFFKKPKITVYVDGPFYPDKKKKKKERQKDLHDKVLSAMKQCSKNSTFTYIDYQPKDK